MDPKTPKTTDSASVVATLRKLIIDGRHPAGTRLAEIAVAEALGVSRTPVRLAFRTLEQEGLLQKAGRALMQQNRSYIFFRDTTAIAASPASGPVGALSVPVTPRVTLAADPAFVPLGAPVWLTGDRPEISGLWVAQDTGGAIKGANRFDSFWGAGAEARQIAGGMSAHGHALILLPKAAAARLPGQ